MASRRLKLTFVTGVVLQAIEQGHRYGFEIMDASGLADGTVYPALRRLEKAGLLESRWEDVATARAEKRPTRRYYALTEAGEAALAQSRARFRGLALAVPKVSEEPAP